MEEKLKFTVHLSILNQPLPITLSHSHSFSSIAETLCQQHDLPPYYTIPLLSAITSAYTLCTSITATSNIQLEQARRHFMNAYQENTLQYYSKHEEDAFPRAFYTLVKCPITLIFDTLLELDQSYTLIMRNLASEHHHALMAMQTRQAPEMDGPSHLNKTHLFAKHVEEMEIMQATFASDMLQTQQTQRQEYREFVMELFREYQLRTATLPSIATTVTNTTTTTTDTNSLEDERSTLALKAIDGKDLVAAAASRIWKKEPVSSASSVSSVASPIFNQRRRQNSTSSMTSRLSHTTNEHSNITAWKRSSVGAEDIAWQRKIQDIQEMGFTKEQAEAALTLSNDQNLERAICLLLESPDQVDQQMQEQQQYQNKRRSASFTSQNTLNNASFSPSSSTSLHQRQNSWNDSIPNFRRQSLQKSVLPTSSSTSSLQQKQSIASNNNANGTKSWNPISFLQQQKQAMENTNLSSVRKLGGWLGKAMENLGIEHDENDPSFANSHGNNASQLVESFTITLGTAQIKSSHNLRLMVADVAADLLDPLPFDEQRELGYKAQTAMRLYTSHLSAMLVLVEKSELDRYYQQGQQDLDWRLYKSGKGSNRALFERSLRSTEFHFPTLESQLNLVEKDIQQQLNLLQEGSYFITKHSNLPSHQIVFHLIIDGEAINTTSLSARHPLMVGLRNILRLTTRYDISSLSLPLIMLPDRYLDQPEHYMPATLDQPKEHVKWLLKRSEILMKTVKGYLMEASRGKQSHHEMHHRTDSSAFGGSGLRNVEFFIPMQQNVYMADPVTATTPTSASTPTSVPAMHQTFTPTSTPPPPPPTCSSSSSGPPHSSDSIVNQQHNPNNNNNNNHPSAISISTTTSPSMHSNALVDGTSIAVIQANSSSNENDNNNNNINSNHATITGSSSSLPSTPTVSHYPHYVRTPTPQVEQVFQHLRTSLVSIFRAS